jgi:hypothetical protein
MAGQPKHRAYLVSLVDSTEDWRHLIALDDSTDGWSYPGLVDGWLVGDDRLRGAPPLIRGGGEIAECGVSPVHVVEPFDVIK